MRLSCLIFRPVLSFYGGSWHLLAKWAELSWWENKRKHNSQNGLTLLAAALLSSPVCLIRASIRKTDRTTHRSEAPLWEKWMTRPSFKPLFDTLLWRGSCVTYQSQRHHVTYLSTEQGVYFTAQLPTLSWSSRAEGSSRSLWEGHELLHSGRECGGSNLVPIF